jgi:hypothetical protein
MRVKLQDIEKSDFMEDMFIIVNQSAGEFIDPYIELDDDGIVIDEDTFGKILIYLMRHEWLEDEIILYEEYSDEYQNILFGDNYEDVTVEAVELYNRWKGVVF